ncbi:NAD-dependent epimerase/dehydratase family protein [Candidatus Parcubacteria bacterium]|nr:NAD-dependent epimerase/dehydratase family protein [Candidatus Parcubacteria bacterium]
MGVLDPIVEEDIRCILASSGDLVRELSGSSILIAGANGFLGSYLVDTIVAANQRLMPSTPATVIALSRTSPEKITGFRHLLQDPHVTFITGDITQPVALPSRVDYVVHAASKASPKAWAAHPIETADANTVGTRRLLELAYANRAKGLLFISSAQVYGDAGAAFDLIPEDFGGTVSPLNLRAAYHEAKRFGETLCYLFHHVHHVPAKIARPFSVYGPRLSLNDGKIVPEFMRRGFAGEDLPVFGEGGAVHAFSYVTDAIDGLLRVLLHGAPGEAYNIGSNEEITVRDLAQLFAELFPGVVIKSVPAGPAPREPRLVPDLGKIQKLGYHPCISLREGLTRFKEWHRLYGGELLKGDDT